MRPVLAEKIKYTQLMEYTDNFSEENFLGTFMFGKVYRGMNNGQSVMVKIWENFDTYPYYREDNEARMMLELILLQHERLKSHPGMIELYGYSSDEKLCVVYNFKPLDTLHNLVLKDSFTWLQRIKVILGFGHLLKFLHTEYSGVKPFLLRNIGAFHIALDEEYNPKLFDFAMISGGIFPDLTIYERCYLRGCHGYVDVYSVMTGKWSDKTDVYAFGVLLINLIAKRIYTEEDIEAASSVSCWAWKLYYPEIHSTDNPTKKRLRSLVHHSFAIDSDFCSADGRKITKLAMKCVQGHPSWRPSMKLVMKYLLKLQVVKKHAEFLGLPSKKTGIDD